MGAYITKIPVLLSVLIDYLFIDFIAPGRTPEFYFGVIYQNLAIAMLVSIAISGSWKYAFDQSLSKRWRRGNRKLLFMQVLLLLAAQGLGISAMLSS